MIPVSLNTLIFVYLGLMLALIFGAWLLSTFRRERRERRAFQGVLRCTLCAFEFHDPSSNLLVACPRCKSLNERRRPSRL